MTNKEFSLENKIFRKACELSYLGPNTRLQPSSRQASKWRMGKGLAITKKSLAVMELAKEKKP